MTASIDWDALKEAAQSARKNAYAPYSKFHVGAAIQANGQIFKGCNVENASYPVGVCAERSALAAAVTAGCRSLEAVVITADKPITPCGMCRQALAEFNQEVPILMICAQLEAQATLGQLLPDPF
ncbi:MAG: cytidine deaminase [Deltaproteobacteria bacterium]|nr:cytidine deaminase [Deltaproteobacteria bacterium]